MEELLLRYKSKDKKSSTTTVHDVLLAQSNNNIIYTSFIDVAQVLRRFSCLRAGSLTTTSGSTASSEVAPDVDFVVVGDVKISNKDDSSILHISASWLLDICSCLPSSQMMGGALPLALSIHEICTKYSSREAELQAALFELIGTDYMDLLLEIFQNASKVATSIQCSDLKVTLEGAASISHVIMDNTNLAAHMLLREEAIEALNIAAIAKAQMEDSKMSQQQQGSMAGSSTHYASRASDKEIIKEAKRAAKRAAAAVAAASEAGVFIDGQQQHNLLSLLDSSTLKNEDENFGSQKKGLAGMTEDDLRAMKANLLPEGSKHYHESLGLPAGTKRVFGDGYEKVTIPPRILDESKRQARIKISNVMSPTESKAFAGTEYLNPMQSTVFEAAFLSQENLLICAPTGAGKTNVAMLSVVAHLRDKGIFDIKKNKTSYDPSGFAPGRKVIYIAPMKALAQEIVEKFDSKLKALKIVVRELTGDMQLTKAEISSADIIVTTPEKFDVVTRKSGDGSLVQTIGLVIIDEVHLLADERGAVIESVVARLHRLVESTQQQMRLVGLSATLPNYRDVAKFLGVTERGLFYFGPEHRPVPLEQTFIGVSTKGRFATERKMNELCYDIVSDSLRRGHQVMVFVHSRKGTGETATALADIAAKMGELELLFLTAGTESNGEAYGRYSERAAKSRNRELSLHFTNGMSIHHAGMLRHDRKLSEQMFSDGAVKVLCCTATLAWGINLPAHTIVVKGTEIYNPEKGGMVDLSILDVQQIFGRAGRPQFDTFGEATLLTSHDALARYLNLLVKDVPIESNFIKQLVDHLNAEVVGGTVTNIREAVEWLTFTYLYVRMVKNPLIYGVTQDQKDGDPLLKGRCHFLVHTAAKQLDELRMLRYDEKSGNLAKTELGAIASNFYIRTESVATFKDKLGRMPSPQDSDLCHLICCASEFENIKVRQDEMDEVDALQKKCALKVDVPTDEFSGKCCVLLQNYISNANITSFTLISDTNYIAQNGVRVSRAMFEMALKDGIGTTALKLLRLTKSIDRRIWWFQSPLRQFHGELQENAFKALESKKNGRQGEYDSMENMLQLLDRTPNEVGELCHVKREGKKIQRLIGMLPRFDVSCSVHPITNSILKFCVNLVPMFEWHPRWHGGALGFWFWIEDSDNDRVYHHEYVLLSRRTHHLPVDLEVKVPVFQPPPSQYYLRIVSDSWVGCESVTPIIFEHLLLPDREMSFTDLLNITPLPVTALKDPSYERIYRSRFEAFNPIQSQLFHILYHSNSNIFVGAPTGSGKTLVAELALMRLKRTQPKAKCVYIAPLKSLARERLKEWRSRFGPSSVNWKILELSGDTHHDARALNEADVLICTPEKWDLISRGWRGVGLGLTNSPASLGKKFIKQVGLLIIDEIHLLGEERGAVLEAIVSRTRLISRTVLEESKSFDETKSTLKKVNGSASEQDITRIIGLSTALANPKDLADWMGISGAYEGSKSVKGLYNFRPSVRPIPMDVHLQGYPGRHYCPRMATMNKPAYAAIKEHSPNQPVLIFVSSRRQTRLTALDLINFAAGDGNPSAFLGCDHNYIEDIAATMSDASLKHTILFGVGIHHAGLSSSDREVVESLFLDGSIQVLVATATLAWGVNLPAHLVIVKGTEYYEKTRYIDYPLTDVLQMIGRAGRPGYSKEGVSVVMVAEEKKPFYKRFLYSPFPVESCLKKRMESVINAEIAGSTINSLSDAVGYLSWTFFFRRVKKNPSYYDVPLDAGDDDFQTYFSEVVKEVLSKLEADFCVKVDREYDDWTVTTTVLGCTASLFYLDFRTPLQMNSSLQDLLHSIVECSTSSLSKDSHSKTALEETIDTEEIEFAVLNRAIIALAWTHEFDELPVRHNEEESNSILWTALQLDLSTKRLLRERCTTKGNEADFSSMMGDPHTKCYLLIMAYLSRTQLPVSDYVNDTKSVLDQLPRLIGAMQFIIQSTPESAGSFDLFCMLTKVKQVLKSRSRIDIDPLVQIPRMAKGDADILRARGFSFLKLCMMDSLAVEKTLKDVIPKAYDLDKAVTFIQSIPVVAIEKASIVQSLDSYGMHTGVCKLELYISAGRGKKELKVDTGNLNLSICLGLPDGQRLLAHRSVFVNTQATDLKKTIELSFDWNLAHASTDGKGRISLYIVREDIRGLDLEQKLSLYYSAEMD